MKTGDLGDNFQKWSNRQMKMRLPRIGFKFNIYVGNHPDLF